MRYRTPRTTASWKVAIGNDDQSRRTRQLRATRPNDLVVQIAAGRRRRALLPDLVLLARDQLLRRLRATSAASSPSMPSRLNHPDRELVIELIQREDRFVGAKRRLNVAEVDGAELLASRSPIVRARALRPGQRRAR